MNTLRVALTLAMLLPAGSAAAQDLSPAIRLSAACAPSGTVAPADAPRIGASQIERRTLYEAGEQVALDVGTNGGVGVNQRYFVRRTMTFKGAPLAEHTVGWLTVVAARDTSAVARIDVTCDAVAVGDHLAPYVELVLPSDIDRTKATGTLDFARSATVLYGVDGRQQGGGRDFMVATLGQDGGVMPGARYAVYHGKPASAAPTDMFGEAVVVSVFPDKALLRITEAHDAVTTGDTLVLRVGGGDPAARATGSAQPATSAAAERAVIALDVPGLDEESSDGPSLVEKPRTAVRSFEFEDLYFDFNRYTLRTQALALLDQAVEALEKDPTLRIHIEGYSCNIGTVAYNLALGQRRANAVRDYLVKRGIAAERLTTTSYGEAQPKYDNAHKDTRRLNRRAALVVNLQRP